jgi:hypothetical protein
LRPSRRIALALGVLALLAAGTAGCSWLVGVSEDPVVVDGTGADDAGDEDAAPE